MNKRTAIVLLSATILLTGCSVGNAEDSTNTASGETMGSSFTRPQERPDITGTIQSIEGNEVTIAKIILPERQGNFNGNFNRNSNGAGGPGAAFTFPGGGAGVGGAAGGGGNFQGRGAGGGGNFQGRGGAGAAGRPGGQAGGQRALANMKTENVVITVPVGIPIAESKREGQKMTYVDKSLSDVQVGQRVTVWSDQNVAKAVVFTRSQSQQQN